MSSIARSNFVSNLTKTQQKLTKNYGAHAVSRAQVFRWHKAFSMAVRVWKTSHFTKDENVTNVGVLMRSDQCLTVRMIGTVMSSLNDSEKGFIMSGQRLRTLGCCITTTLPVTLPSLNEFFTKKEYSSGSASPILTCSVPV